MSPISSTRLINASAALVFVIIIAVFIISFRQADRVKDNQYWVDHTHQVITQIHRVMQSVLGYQSSARGYAITGDSIYLDETNKSGDSMLYQCSLLKSLTADNINQKILIDSLRFYMTRRIEMVRTLVSAKDSGIKATVKSMVHSSLAHFNTVKISGICSQMEKTEVMLLQLRKGKNNKSIAINNGILYATLVGVFILSIGLANWIKYSIRQQTKAEQQFKAQHKYKETLENMLEGVQILDHDMQYIYANDAVAKQAGMRPEQLIGKRVTDLFPGVEQTALYNRIKNCLAGQQQIQFEDEFKFPDQQVKYFLLTLQPIPEGVCILSVDITDRKLAEEKLKKLNEELEEKVITRTQDLKKSYHDMEAFSYSISHDLRAPIRGINSFANILKEDHSVSLDKEGLRVTDIIIQNSVTMGRLIDDLLAFSKVGQQGVTKMTFDTNQFVQHLVNELNTASPGIDWKIHNLAATYGDTSVLKQVWVNLINNAIKYSSRKTAPLIEIGSMESANDTTFFVKDNGIGFDEAYKHKLFKVFERLHGHNEFEGMGIGLAIVQKIVLKHGGVVWAEGKNGEGATFYFTIPKQ